MKFIDLYLYRYNKEVQNKYLLNDVIAQNNIIVILGAPGSGKTSILKKYQSENKNVQLLKVKSFIKFDNQIDEKTEILLLDGLDEYRSTTNDKTFVMSEIGNKINKLSNLKIVISCRSLDWYGETDQDALKEQINQKAEVYSILPLDYEQQRVLANMSNIEDVDTFTKKFSSYGFLENPQMFKMVAELFKENPDGILESKKTLYETFIKNAREQNLTHKSATAKQLEPNEILKYTGYLASYYMFSSIDEFNENILDNICSNEKGYRREDLEATLRTTLFDDRRFIHRTIAEFSLAYFLVNYKLNDTAISKNRIKSLFVKDGKIPTELRSVYAWVCSLIGDKEFISVDPYYQTVYGDNTHFSDELKREIVLAVREYAKTNPYFIDFGRTRDIEGFYTDELGEFLTRELKNALKQKNHYAFFLINIFRSAKTIDEEVKKYLKSVIADNSVKSYIRDNLVEVFKDDIDFLKEVLKQIQENKVQDSGDEIKEAILSILYPKYITPTEVGKYIILFKSGAGRYSYYLYNTPYLNKFDLVNTIHKTCYKTKENNNYLLIPENIEPFVSDYFLETLLKYKEGLSEEEIYKFIKHFRQYYDKYQHIEFESFRLEILDKEKKKELELIELANAIFSLYLDDFLKDNNKQIDYLYNFNSFFSYKKPTYASDIIFSKMDAKFDANKNKALFYTALSYLPRDENNKVIATEKLQETIKKFGYEEKFEKYQNNPAHIKLEKIRKKRKTQQEAKDKKIRDENEQYFSSKSDQELQRSFSALNYIEQFYYIKDADKKALRYFTKETLKRLTKILKNAIYSPLIEPKYLTLESLAKDSPQASRNIDRVYFSSVFLNKGSDIHITNKEFLKYLYINCLVNSNTGNINHGDLIERIEERDREFVLQTLKEYISLLLDTYIPKYKELFWKYVKNEVSLEELKQIAKLSNYQQSYEESILENCLNAFHFNISLDDLENLGKIDTSNKNYALITALKTFQENKREKFTINMAIILHEIFGYHYYRFNNLESSVKVKIIDYMMNQFNTEKSIESVNGVQSDKNICAFFLHDNSLSILTIEELKALQKLHKYEDDIWHPRIANKISKLKQQNRDQAHQPLTIEKIKNFIFSDDIVSQEDFYADVKEKLNALKTEIEDNRNNDKKPFYNSYNSKKDEESCRDIILHRLSDKYGKDLDLTKEKYEANNRVDINIKYRADQNYEVQIECKRDDNQAIYRGIQEQLIDKYFASNVQYGIYLIFYFGDKKDKKKFLQKVQNSRPKKYANNIEIICIDLRI